MMQDKFFIISKLGIYLKYFPFSMMRTRYQFLSWPLLLISAFFLLGIFFVAKDAFAQVSSCPGIASTQLSPDGNYRATAFGCGTSRIPLVLTMYLTLFIGKDGLFTNVAIRIGSDSVGGSAKQALALCICASWSIA